MHKELEHELWESFLKTAVIENSLNEIKDYPSKEELKRIPLPEHYDLKMRRSIKHYNRKIKFQSALKYCRKIASAILIFMGISLAILLQNEDVRAACQNVIVKIFDRYIRINHTADLVSDNAPIEFGYIPEEFSLTEAVHNTIGSFAVYQNADGEFFRLNYDTQKHNSYYDNEHYLIYPVQVDSVEGLFFESQDELFMNILVWDAQTHYFRLTSSLEKEEMIKIAENLK